MLHASASLNKNRKGKGKNTQSQISHQENKPLPRKSPIDP